MNWREERYVRLYVRDSVDWALWPWQARALLPLLMRRLDRSGLLPLGKHGVRGLAELVRLPVEVVGPGLEALVADGCVVDREGVLEMPNFVVAQESRQSDAQRQRDSRGRARHQPSPAVTNGHQQSPEVTDCHSVPSCAVPSCAVEDLAGAGAPPPPPKAKKTRKPSAAQGFALELEAARLKALPPGTEPDTSLDPAAINARLGSLLHEHGAASLRAAHALYLADPWALGLTPKCPLQALLSQKVLPGFLRRAGSRSPEQPRCTLFRPGIDPDPYDVGAPRG